MGVIENKKKVRLYYQAIETRKFNLFREIFHDQWEFQFNTRKELITHNLAESIELRSKKHNYNESFKINYLIGEDDAVIADLLVSVTLVSKDESGNDVHRSGEFRAIHSFRFKEGKVIWLSWLGDTFEWAKISGFLNDDYVPRFENNLKKYISLLEDQGYLHSTD